jgi:hypothetical protein
MFIKYLPRLVVIPLPKEKLKAHKIQIFMSAQGGMWNKAGYRERYDWKHGNKLEAWCEKFLGYKPCCCGQRNAATTLGF